MRRWDCLDCRLGVFAARRYARNEQAVVVLGSLQKLAGKSGVLTRTQFIDFANVRHAARTSLVQSLPPRLLVHVLCTMFVTLLLRFVNLQTHPSMLFPAYQLQIAIQRGIGGIKFWKRIAKRRCVLVQAALLAPQCCAGGGGVPGWSRVP